MKRMTCYHQGPTVWYGVQRSNVKAERIKEKSMKYNNVDDNKHQEIKKVCIRFIFKKAKLYDFIQFHPKAYFTYP